jgi:hypothetical protein
MDPVTDLEPNSESVDPMAPIRGEVRLSGYRRVSHGLYLPPGAAAVTSTREETLHDLRAWRLVLPEDAVFTHITAASLNGWWLPNLLESVPVFAATRLESNRPRRPGLVCSRLDRTSQPELRHGLPVDSAAEVLLRAARDLAMLDLVPMIESAMRARQVNRDALVEICSTRRPGVRPLRRASMLADPRSESPWETSLRLFHLLAGIPVEPQRDLFTDDGRFIGRCDLLITGTNFVQEYDGADHRQPARHTQDLRRDRRFADTPFIRRGYTADDLLNHDVAVLQEIDRFLGRRFMMSRLNQWRRWVSESTYSEAGRARLLNRWRRIN